MGMIREYVRFPGKTLLSAPVGNPRGSRQERCCLGVRIQLIGRDNDPRVSLRRWWERPKQVYFNLLE